MLFNSYEFFVLVLATLFIYYIPAVRRWQVHILIFSSLVFYGWNNPSLLALFISSAGINVWASYMVTHGDPSKRKAYATLGVVVNLLILCFFKYSPLISVSFFPPTSDIGMFLVQIPLPIGISFYTFEGISLLVDAYKGRDIEKFRALVPKDIGTHAVNTTFFVAFFPHLIAGPILKAHDFIPQIKEKYFSKIDWNAFFNAALVGFFLKMVIADNLKEHTFWIAYPYFESMNSGLLIMMIFGYSMQILADFAGYSLIAIGISHLFGYRLPQNFNFPYVSRSITEFWRRWHISLSSFLKEYLYFPLGGNRKGIPRMYFNLIVVMFLGGLWHGASWSFALWGTFHGVCLAIERLFKPYVKAPTSRPGIGLAILATFTLVTLSRLMFVLPIQYAWSYFIAMFTQWDIPIAPLGYLTIVCIILYSIPVILYHIWHVLGVNIGEYRIAFPIRRYAFVGYGLMLFFIIVSSGTAGDFIYFQF